MAFVFLEKLEDVAKSLHVLVAQDPQPVPDNLPEAAAANVAKRQYEDHARLVAALRTEGKKLSSVVELLRELDLAKDPDEERLAQEILVQSFAGARVSYDDARKAASTALKRRNELRADSPKGKPKAK